MFCQKCGTQNPDDGKFCKKCGIDLKSTVQTERTGISGKLGKMGIPGFRSGKTWKMIVAIFGYFFIFMFLLAMLSPSPTQHSNTAIPTQIGTPVPKQIITATATPEPTTKSTTQPAKTVQTVSEAINQKVLLDSIVMGSVSTMSKNWDADAEDDGFVVNPTLKDAADQTVQFENVEMPVEIKIYTTKYDDKMNEINDRLVYTGSSKINSWKDGNFMYSGGIKIPYDQITTTAADKQFGRLYVTVTLPDGRKIESKYDYTRLRLG